jgi:hypothetical protein
MHVYPMASMSMATRTTLPHGRRGKPIKKMRFMPAERAHFWPQKLQGRPGTTVSVI